MKVREEPDTRPQNSVSRWDGMGERRDLGRRTGRYRDATSYVRPKTDIYCEIR